MASLEHDGLYIYTAIIGISSTSSTEKVRTGIGQIVSSLPDLVSSRKTVSRVMLTLASSHLNIVLTERLNIPQPQPAFFNRYQRWATAAAPHTSCAAAPQPSLG